MNAECGIRNAELKPVRCGCGGDAKVVLNNKFNYCYVYCEKCIMCSGHYATETEAIKAWNTAMGAKDTNVPDKEERVSMVWKPAKGRPVYEKGVCSCGYVLSVLQRDFVYCPSCGARLELE